MNLFNTLWASWIACFIMAVASMIIREPAGAYITGMFVISAIMYIEDNYLKKTLDLRAQMPYIKASIERKGPHN